MTIPVTFYRNGEQQHGRMSLKPLRGVCDCGATSDASTTSEVRAWFAHHDHPETK